MGRVRVMAGRHRSGQPWIRRASVLMLRPAHLKTPLILALLSLSVSLSAACTEDGAGASKDEESNPDCYLRSCRCADFGAGWCITGGDTSFETLQAACDQHGGTAERGTCPSGYVGSCRLEDDCGERQYFLYDEYAGGLFGWSDFAEAEAGCNAGDAGSCLVWGGADGEPSGQPGVAHSDGGASH